MFASTFVVLVEPAPSDILFVFVLLVFLTSGLAINSLVAPLILFLLLYNIGGVLSYLQIADDNKAQMFVVTSFYMAISAVFFAFYIGQDTVRRAALIKNALVIAAVISSVFAIAGAFGFNAFNDGPQSFDYKDFNYNRAVGLFKDPNVYATYLLLPALLLVQGFMLGTQKWRLVSAVSLIIILTGLFLAFSRGAWISFVMSVFLLFALTFLLTQSNKMRLRVVTIFVLGLLISSLMLALLLSYEPIRNVFLDRFTLVKSYDGGETGRFANQLNSIPLLLQRPFGLGPYQFATYFRIAPHNTYINAFSAYGWLGGVSYLILILISLVIAVKTVFVRTPWQNFSIVVFCPLVSTIFQSIQIDIDHWRHFYWLLGLMWGLFAVTTTYQAENQPINSKQ
jgi:MFS family permease